MPDPIRFRGVTTVDDLTVAARYISFRRSRSVQFMLIAGPAAVALGAWIGASATDWGGWPFVALGVFYMCVALSCPRRSARRSTRCMPSLTEECTYQIASDGVQLKRASMDGVIRWAAVHEVVELPTCFLLFTSRVAATVIPKRFMEPTQVKAARAALRDAMTAAGKPFQSAKTIA